MEWTMIIMFILLMVTSGLYKAVSILFQRDERKRGKENVHSLIVLGSGGHTSEMLRILSSKSMQRNLKLFSPRIYIVAEGDKISKPKAESFEMECRKSGSLEGKQRFSIEIVPRSREVGQSWILTPFSIVKGLLASFLIMMRYRPDVILCNGPGTCVPFCFLALLLRIIRIKRIPIIYAESFACVEHLSLSGKILYRFADQFIVQWEELNARYPLSRYIGVEIDSTRKVEVKKNGTVLVTVGSYYFDDLLRELDSKLFLENLKRLGYSKLIIQIGKGKFFPKEIQSQITDFQVQVITTKDSLREEFEEANLVISHAGAGSILDSLLSGKPTIAVPNEELMNNHQVQLAQTLANKNLLRTLQINDTNKKSFLDRIIEVIEHLNDNPPYCLIDSSNQIADRFYSYVKRLH
eukprot:TRINITY_DN2483_c0_g1_i1.p2 TRINITY_DN2483_c0_g1~~TRINITY_DN2483_c0_g1_i1.p2  ORF type:complete len:408 (-),score=77.88 TRINITY_DN2483_c0_g1_i1:2247-3470(-)